MKHLIALFILSFSLPSLATVTVGLVDIQKVLTSIKEGQGVLKTLEKSYNDKKALLKKEEEAIKKGQESFKKQAAVLSEQARTTKEQEIQDKVMKLQSKTMEYQREIQKQEQDLKKPILEKLRPIIDEVSKSAGVAMTFELGSAPIVYAESKKDLTDDIVKAYDKKHPSK